MLTTSPAELEELKSLPVYDAAIRSLASNHHPQQRRQLLRNHQDQLSQFIHDTNLQWDSDDYVTNRISKSRPLESLVPTPDLRHNIEASKPEYGCNAPPHSRGVSQDKMSINELQLQLSNQAAAMRLKMAKEDLELRLYQKSEIETFIKVKQAKEPEFERVIKEAKEARKRDEVRRRQESRKSVPLPLNRESTRNGTRRDSLPSGSSTRSPVLHMSPGPMQSPNDTLDINILRNDTSVKPFAKFFLHLPVVQQNWPAVSREWMHTYTVFQRGLMTEKAFAQGVLQDALTRHDGVKFMPEAAAIHQTRAAMSAMDERMRITRIVAEVILELAEAGEVDFTSRGDSVGTKIIFEAMSIEEFLLQQQAESQPPASAQVGKATDPRQRTL
jgi:hypothetical protein